MSGAISFPSRGCNQIHFIQTLNLLAREPEPSRTPGALAACPYVPAQPCVNHAGSFWRQSGSFEIRRRHEKKLRENGRVRLKRYHAPTKRFKLRGKNVAQTFKAKRNFRTHQLSAVGSFPAKVQRIGQNRSNPTDIIAQMNTLGSSPF